jgi:peptide/nickel transport system permease protein
MRRYLGKRAITAVISVLLVLVINFTIIRLAPGDPARLLVGTENPTAEQVELITKKYGLDQPVYMQFLKYLGNLLKGDMGVSYYTNEPVSKLIAEKLGYTALLTLTALVIAVVLGTWAGIACARHIGGKLDNFVASITYIIDGFPSFWLGLMLMLVFASILGILPYSGVMNIRESYTGMRRVLDVAEHMILPVSTLAILHFPYYFRISRSSMIQTLGEEYMTTLWVAGMPKKRIFRKYAFRNAILPTVTAVSIHMAYIVTGSALVEIVYSWPGMGSYVMQSISRRDYPVLMGIYLMLSVSVAVMMIVIDVLYAVLDPRISHATKN